MKNLKSFNNFNESEKWIQDAIKHPGSLRKSLNKKKGEKITTSEITDEISKLKDKDKDPNKKGIQGLSKNDLAKFRKLNLAKTLKGFKESDNTNNYMFFQNLNTMKTQIEEMLSWSEEEIDNVLGKGHEWAVDHICTSKDDISEVYEFLLNIRNGSI